MEAIRSRTGVPVEVMDLHFQGASRLIASYLIRHANGVMIVETGPGTTVGGLELELRRRSLGLEDVTHALVTHVHLDHAGAAGWLARQGAHIYAHPQGAPHLIDPERLLSSAARIYGDDMDRLWGECEPVPADRITTLEDGDEVAVGGVSVVALDTPGHAEHHLAFMLDDICFTGDVGGVRMPHTGAVVPPTPPPEFDPERWRRSLDHIEAHRPEYLAPTHFGLFLDPDEHLAALRRNLKAVEQWAGAVPPEAADTADAQARYTAWLREQCREQGIDDADWQRHEMINPSWMSALGLYRYWKKHLA